MRIVMFVSCLLAGFVAAASPAASCITAAERSAAIAALDREAGSNPNADFDRCKLEGAPGRISACDRFLSMHGDADAARVLALAFRADARLEADAPETFAGSRESLALSDVSAALSIDPKSAEALRMAAVINLHVERHPQVNGVSNGRQNMTDARSAVASLTRAIELKPDFAQAYADRGTAYRELKQNEEALADFNSAIRLDSRCAAFLFDRSYLYRAKQQLDLALADLNEAVRIDGSEPRFAFGRGAINQELKRYPESAADFERALQLGYEPYFAQLGIGSAKQGSGDCAGAVLAFDAALKVRDGIAARHNRALARRCKGDLFGALYDENRERQLRSDGGPF